MLTALLYALGASLPLGIGAAVGVRWQPPQRLVAAVLTYAASALIVADTWLDRRTPGSATGLALFAGVTLDGIPENTALGVSLNESASLALLVAVFVSNFPEALVGARSMLDAGRSPRFVVGVWCGATVPSPPR